MESMVLAFAINLEVDKARRDFLVAQFLELKGFELRFVAGCYGNLLAQSVCEILTQDRNWATNHKGTLGCFLSHVRAWEEVANLNAPYAIVLEDDVDARGLDELLSIEIPDDAEIVFLNERISPLLYNEPLRVMPVWNALRHIDKHRQGIGGDGYLLTPSGASRLIQSCTKDLYFGHVDGRLLRYATSNSDLAELAPDSWIASVILNHHHKMLMPPLGLLKGYCLSYPLVRHLGVASSREALDKNK